MGGAEMAGRGNGMKWRVMLELIGGDGTVSTYEIGGCALIADRNGRLRMSVRGGLSSLFGTVEVRVPRFSPCRCAVTPRHTLNPVAEIMPDRCTPEYECVIAKMGSLLPYRRARTLLSNFLPIGDVPAVETSRRRTMRVGARLEQRAVASQSPHQRPKHRQSRSPSTAATCGQSEVIRLARSR